MCLDFNRCMFLKKCFINILDSRQKGILNSMFTGRQVCYHASIWKWQEQILRECVAIETVLCLLPEANTFVLRNPFLLPAFLNLWLNLAWDVFFSLADLVLSIALWPNKLRVSSLHFCTMSWHFQCLPAFWA